MGEARRRRAAIGNEVGTAFETTSGGSLPARYGGRLGEFLAGVDLAKPRPVPCNGCNHCCYYGHVNIDPAKERAEDLAHLDVVPHETGGFALRKREDGACIHLGPDGCTVYDHRPRACRFYDCRLFSLIGMVDTFDGGRHRPRLGVRPNHRWNGPSCWLGVAFGGGKAHGQRAELERRHRSWRRPSPSSRSFSPRRWSGSRSSNLCRSPSRKRL